MEFIGRESELKKLNELYDSDKFEFAVVYGRRRVGKTELLKKSIKTKKAIFYQALEQNNSLNIKIFCDMISKYFNISFSVNYNNWQDVFMFLTNELKINSNERHIIIIDEFPYLAKEDPSIKSVLQHIIDNEWKDLNIKLILCGSSVSFMINEVLGYNSPLYGRRTANFEIKPLDYLTSSLFFPNYTNEEKLLVYGILGGIPYYLRIFNPKLSIKENIQKYIVEAGSVLSEEPVFLLKMEFREPSLYNSILCAIAQGSSKLNEISTKINEDSSKVIKYLNNLIEIKLIEKQTPYGEKDSKRSIYAITDNYFSFWFKYIFKIKNENITLTNQQITENIYNDLSSFMGLTFEKICTQYVINQAQKKQLPFDLLSVGKWWGNNPQTKKQDDIDILGIEKTNGLFCECKFRNEKFDINEFNDLIIASNIFNIKNKYYYIFLKSECTDFVLNEFQNYKVKVITINDLFLK